MVSEVKGAGSQAAQALTHSLRKVDEQQHSAAADTARRSEVVTVTDLATRLQRLSEAVQDLPVVDQARVAELRDAIANGDYSIDDKQVADKLASFEALLGRLERE